MQGDVSGAGKEIVTGATSLPLATHPVPSKEKTIAANQARGLQAKLVISSVNPLEPSLWNINHSFTSVWSAEAHCLCVYVCMRKRER